MEQFQLLSEAGSAPAPADTALAALGFAKWNDAVAETNADTADQCRAFESRPEGHAILEAIFGNSPFLSQILLRNLDSFVNLACYGPDARFENLASSVTYTGILTDEAVMSELRQKRIAIALVIALADIAGIWSLERVTAAISDFAETAIHRAANHLIGWAISNDRLGGYNIDRPAETSGYTILGMGKLGARELNYSSDVDLVVLFDQERIDYRGTDDPQSFFVDLTRRLVRILQERTADGYVFRTDLRLRPDPGATPLALSMAAAERYYESVGQNWERAAFIKASPIAGDRDAGREFLERIAPFVWRKHLDFAAIADIHSIKRQITAHRGHAKTAIDGHNIKVGRGGIREIEFFVQTQQLIAGGKDSSLRTKQTLEGLKALALAGRIETKVVTELSQSYRYLRRLEHRLQMINDEQTHTLPTDEEKLANVAIFMGSASLREFRDELKGHLDSVVSHYARLFEREDPLGGSSNLVFTGGVDDPGTLETLTELGFRAPERVSERIRSWHHGRFAATRAVRSRELLTLLMPRLLDALSQTADPGAAFVKFDEFLERLPAGVQLFSLFNENPTLLDLVAEIMGTAPRLADALSHNATLFDAVLSPEFFDPLPSKPELAEHLRGALENARDYQDILDISRRWANEHKFQVGVQILRNTVTAADAGPALSDLADVLVERLANDVGAELANQHGKIQGGEFAVVALGKLGARELTPVSDLDLVFVYDFDPNRPESDGAKPLSSSQYYTRLSQRLISALTVLTGEGRLYEVDMRLRPTGNSGPVAIHLDGFERYQQETAWTWEHMSLTRARIVAAPPDLRERTDRVIKNTLQRDRDPEALVRDVAEMRGRIEKEHGTDDIWDVKYVRGGLTDLQFLCQYLQLANARQYPELIGGSTANVFDRLAKHNVVDQKIADDLARAAHLMINIQGMLRLTISGAYRDDDASDSLRNALARAGATENPSELHDRLVAVQSQVLAEYQRHIGNFQRADHPS
jgi:glutamate-ammonia-ligase adenylyltransferase